MDIRLSEIVAALSHALDVTEGQPMGHAERTCIIGLRLADAVGLEPARRSSLFYALLLKDAGCSTTRRRSPRSSARTTCSQARAAGPRPQQPAQSLRALSRTIAPGAPLRQRARHLRALVAMGVEGARELGAAALRARRRDRPRDRPRRGRGRAPSAQLDEHWDGARLPATAWPARPSRRSARSSAWPRAIEVFWSRRRRGRRLAVARERRGTWFDPALVDAVATLRARRRLLGLAARARRQRAGAGRPRASAPTTPAWTASPRPSRRIVDAKSPYTASHSRGRGRDRRGHRGRMGSTRPRAACCTAPACCTTSASSASPTASSTSPASSTPRSGPRCAATPSCRG